MHRREETYIDPSACMLADLIDSGYTTSATLVAGCFAYACDDEGDSAVAPLRVSGLRRAPDPER